MFNNLPEGIKNVSDNLQQFESALKNYLLTLYSVEQYCNVNIE